MQKDSKILTIDVGSANLKMAEFECAAGSLRMTKFDFRKLEIDPENGEAAEQIAFIQAYHAMLLENNFTAKAVRLTLPAKLSFQRLSKLPPIPSSRSAIDKIVEYEARQTVPYAINDVEWGYQLIRHEWKEKRVETQEDGSLAEVTEDKEEYEAMFVAMKTDIITGYTDVIEDSGRRVLSVEIAPIALFNAAMGGQIKEGECTMLLNIGSGSSSLMIADSNRAFIRNIPIAGDTITNQISKEYGISFSEAEQMKLRHGFVALGGAYEEPDSELAATISKISRNVMTRLHGEVSRSVNVWRAQHGGGQPVQVLLSGGSSSMLYMSEFFQEKLRIPVTYLNSFGAIAIADEVDKEKLQNVAPMCQELIGTAFHSATRCPINISLLPRSIRNQYELNRRKPYFYASAGILLGCLLLFGFGVDQLLRRQQDRVDRVRSRVEETAKKEKAVAELMGQLNGAKGRWEELDKIFRSRTAYASLLLELQKIIPDQMWLVSIEPSDVMPPEPPKAGVAQPADGDSGGDGDQNSKQYSPEKERLRDQRNIKFLILKGYALSVTNNLTPGKTKPRMENWLLKFRERLRKSTKFDGEGRLYTNKEERKPGLTRFYIILTLKTQLDK